MTRFPLKAPFPAFGGKSRAAQLVWARLGNPDNFIEPFCFTAATLLLRPDPPRIETINDVNGYVANFWRAVQHDPEATAAHADWPVNEADLHARHRWLVLSVESAEFRERMRRDPDYYDAKVAGWWAWGACCWIGSGWCEARGAEVSQLPRLTNDVRLRAGGHGQMSDQIPRLSTPNGQGVDALPAQVPLLSSAVGADSNGGTGEGSISQQLPKLHGFASGCVPESSGTHLSMKIQRLSCPAGQGVNALTGNHRPQLADAFSRGRGVHGNDSAGTCEQRRAWLVDWFSRLADRLRTVRVCCGHWRRVCDSPSTTTRLGITGIFLDPPYPTHGTDGVKSRAGGLYASDGDRDELDTLRDEVLAYCLERGGDPQMRICVAGYDTDGYAALESEGWECVPWKASGGYANRNVDGNKNRERERLYFSPNCVKPNDDLPLFATKDAAP